MTDQTPILIVVHPGSACGSADCNLGQSFAIDCRALLVDKLNGWFGGIVILDGALSDELPKFPALRDALEAALTRSVQAGHLALREEADDPDQVDVARRIFADQTFDRTTPIVLTGAWYDADDREGCVNSVCEVLRELHYDNLDVDDTALQLDTGSHSFNL
jgi:hypothetical protein